MREHSTSTSASKLEGTVFAMLKKLLRQFKSLVAGKKKLIGLMCADNTC